jgi:predicted nucleotidyltransferase
MLDRNGGIKYAQEFVHRVVSKGIDIKYAKLFGSYSKNTQTPDSDIDIALVADAFIGVGFIDSSLIVDELYEFDIVQVKTYNSKDYEEGDPLIDEINRTGIVLDVN